MARFADRPRFQFPGPIALAQRVALSCVHSFDHRAGYVIALEGEEGSGRSTMLDMIADEVSTSYSDVRILRLSFSDGRLKALPGNAQTFLSHFFAGLKWSTSLTGPIIGPAGPAVSTLANTIGAGAGVAESVAERSALIAPSEMSRFRREIRKIANNGPLLILVDDIEKAIAAPSWWEAFLKPLTLEIQTQLPVSMVLSCPLEINDLDFETVQMRSLSARGLSHVVELPRLSDSDIMAALMPADGELVRFLERYSAGNAAMLTGLLADFEREGTIEVEALTGRRYFVKQPDPDSFALDLLEYKINRVAQSAVHLSADEMRDWLAVAALEGRQFTVAAVAEVLSVDRDTLTDAFDEISTTNLPGAGLLNEIEPLIVTDEYALWRYEFASAETWRVLDRYGLPSDRRQAIAKRYTNVLASLSEKHAVQTNLAMARLFELAGDEARSREAREHAMTHMTPEWKTHLIDLQLEADHSAWGLADYTSSFTILYRLLPLHGQVNAKYEIKALEFAIKCAEQCDAHEARELLKISLAGVLRRERRDEDAERLLREARDSLQVINPRLANEASLALANLLLFLRRYEEGENEARQTLVRSQSFGADRATASCWYLLAVVAADWHHDSARSKSLLDKAWHASAGRYFEIAAAVADSFAIRCVNEGDLPNAGKWWRQALDMYRLRRDKHEQTEILLNLARVEFRAGAYQTVLLLAEEAAALAIDIAYQFGLAQAWYWLSEAALATNQLQAALSFAAMANSTQIFGALGPQLLISSEAMEQITKVANILSLDEEQARSAMVSAADEMVTDGGRSVLLQHADIFAAARMVCSPTA